MAAHFSIYNSSKKISPISGCTRRIKTLVKSPMKRVMLMLMAVIACSLSAWCQTTYIVSLGTAALEKNNFFAVKQMFKEKGFNFEEYASDNTHAVGMSGAGDSAIMWVIDANPNETIKEVAFLCGVLHWYGIDKVLSDAGYTCINKGTTIVSNGEEVPQDTWSNGYKRCYVQSLDNCMAHIIFKRKVTRPKPKRRK